MSDTTIASSNSTCGIIWIKLSVLYLLLGVALGIGMGASEDFRLHAVHAHINLLGWATMLLLGNPKVIPILASAEMIAAAGVITFAVNIFINLKKA